MNKQGFILGLDQLLPSSEEQESIPGTAWAGEVPSAGCSSCVQSWPPSVSLLDVCCDIPALWLYQALLSLLEPRAPAEDGALELRLFPVECSRLSLVPLETLEKTWSCFVTPFCRLCIKYNSSFLPRERVRHNKLMFMKHFPAKRNFRNRAVAVLT